MYPAIQKGQTEVVEMKILINALSGIGDALMFSPALKVLSKKFPNAKIDMLAMFQSVKQMYRFNPCLNEIYFIDFLHQSKIKSIKEIYSIRSKKYDIIINTYPANRAEYNILSFLLGGKRRIATKYLKTSVTRLDFLNTDLSYESPDTHNVIQNINTLRLICDIRDEEIGPMEIYLSGEVRKSSSEWVEKINPEKRIIIGIHAGSSILKNHIHKRWDKKKYIELCKRLINEKNAIILLFGNEVELNEEIKKSIGENAILASTDDYMDSMGRLSHCKLFVSNDTAFLHSSAALGIPVAGIFGYTNYKELYPWGTTHRIIRKELECSPCFFNSPKPASCKFEGEDEFKCIKTITVDEVFNACDELLNT